MPSGRSFSCAAVKRRRRTPSSRRRRRPCPALATMMALLPMIWLSSIGFGDAVGLIACGAVVRRQALDAEIVEQLADVLGRVGRPVEIRRVELDDLVAHLGDGRDGALEVLGQLAADRVELDADGHFLRLRACSRQERRGKRHRAGHGEERASGKIVVFHAGEVAQFRPRCDQSASNPESRGLQEHLNHDTTASLDSRVVVAGLLIARSTERPPGAIPHAQRSISAAAADDARRVEGARRLRPRARAGVGRPAADAGENAAPSASSSARSRARTTASRRSTSRACRASSSPAISIGRLATVRFRPCCRRTGIGRTAGSRTRR